MPTIIYVTMSDSMMNGLRNHSNIDIVLNWDVFTKVIKTFYR